MVCAEYMIEIKLQRFFEKKRRLVECFVVTLELLETSLTSFCSCNTFTNTCVNHSFCKDPFL